MGKGCREASFSFGHDVRQVVVMDGCSRRPKRPSTRIFARCVRISGVSVFFRLNTFDLTMRF